MRIRKHAKISPLLYTTSSLNPAAVIQTHVCQLNQSPWDVITFPPQDPATLPPPPPFLVDNEYYRSYMENRTFVHHIGADESPKEEKCEDMVVAAGRVNNEKEDEDRSKLEKEEEEIILCSKTDRKGWQCGERVKNGHSFCEHHLPKGKTQGNVSAHPKRSEENRRRPKPRKPATSSNPYEYYYYSGFGPRWGKKRGSEAAATGTAGTTTTTTAVVVKQEPYSSSPESGSSATSSTSKNTSIIEDAADNEGPNASDSTPTTPEPNNVKVSVFSEFANEGIDYVEDEDDEDYEEDDDDDDDENGEMGKKRARKPIKARSLKSLM